MDPDFHAIPQRLSLESPKFRWSQNQDQESRITKLWIRFQSLASNAIDF